MSSSWKTSKTHTVGNNVYFCCNCVLLCMC